MSLCETNIVAVCLMLHDNRGGQLSHLATRGVNKSQRICFDEIMVDKMRMPSAGLKTSN